MIVIHVSVQTKEDVTNEFEQILRSVVDDAHKVTGCAKYEWYRVPNQPRQYVVYGEFDTKENFENYLKSTLVQRIGAELIPLLTAPPTFKHFEATILEDGG